MRNKSSMLVGKCVQPSWLPKDGCQKLTYVLGQGFCDCEDFPHQNGYILLRVQ